jgi:hypothetical protein
MDCIRVSYINGSFTPLPNVTVENWGDILFRCDNYYHKGKIKGWGSYTDCYQVIIEGKVIHYLVEMPIW